MADQTLGAGGATGNQTATLTPAEDLIGLQIALKRASTSYTYDPQGNRITRASATYSYDQANRLKTAAGTTYCYNGDGLRMSNAACGAQTNTRFVWDVAEGLPLLLSDGTNNYLYGPGGEPLEQIPIQTITFVGGGSNQDGTAGALTSLKITLTQTPQPNDQVLLTIDDKPGQFSSVPAGYTQVPGSPFPGVGATNSELRVYRHTAGSGEGNSITVNFNATPAHPKAVAAVIYRGVDPNTPIDVIGQAGTTPGGTSVTAPSVTTTQPGEELVMIGSGLVAATTQAGAWGFPQAMSVREQSDHATGTLGVSLAMADQTLGAGGATGNQTATLTPAEDLIGLQIALKKPAPAIMYLHQDQLGSTRLLTDTAGVVQATYSYDAYGNIPPGWKTGTATTPLQYAGQYTDAETGFQYLRTRYYDPATGQFLGRDPETGITQSPYGYVDSNPLNDTDPTGLCFFCLSTLKTVAEVTVAVVAVAAVAACATATAGVCLDVAVAAAGAVGPTALATAAGVGTLGTVAAVLGAAPGPEAEDVGITGFTRHGLNQAISRDDHGVCPNAILNAVREPLQTFSQDEGSTLFIGRDANVVLNTAGKVVTTWATNSKGWRS